MKRLSLGFTLLEVLIAMGLLALISAALLPTLYNAGRFSLVSVTRAETLEEMQTAEALLRRLVQSTVIPPKSDRALRFSGSTHGMQFFVVDPLFDGPAKVAIHSVPVGSQDDLRLKIKDIDRPQHLIQEITLLENKAQIRFEYFGKTEDGRRDAWHNSWLSRRPPSLVAVVVYREGMHQERIEVNSIVNAPYFCDYDAVSRNCRD